MLLSNSETTMQFILLISATAVLRVGILRCCRPAPIRIKRWKSGFDTTENGRLHETIALASALQNSDWVTAFFFGFSPIRSCALSKVHTQRKRCFLIFPQLPPVFHPSLGVLPHLHQYRSYDSSKTIPGRFRFSTHFGRARHFAFFSADTLTHRNFAVLRFVSSPPFSLENIGEGTFVQ